MKAPNHNSLKTVLISFLLISIFQSYFLRADDNDFDLPPLIRAVRIFGDGQEANPPILVINQLKYPTQPPYAYSQITIEVDVASELTPALYAKFVHCSADWIEDENVFLTDIVYNRSGNFIWESAPMSSKYYQYRGQLTVPNEMVKFKVSGNWKAKIYDYDENLLAESRFFIVEPKAECELYLHSDFYNPDVNIGGSAFTFEGRVSSELPLFENRMNIAALYRNHRWWEPYYISTKEKYSNKNREKFRYEFKTSQGGFVSFAKTFVIERIPAENGYRVLDLTNMAEFPQIYGPVSFAMSDLRSNGNYLEAHHDGALLTNYVREMYDDYVLVEFLMDPLDKPSDKPVFVSGSFNGFKPDDSWGMYYDPDSRLYKLRQWVRRGVHDYLYCTGYTNYEKREVESIAYDEFEGNTSSSGHSYIMLIYYREFEFGGYDALISIGASNIFGPIR